MHAFLLSYPSAAENVMCDEWLLQEAERGGGEVLRFWENPSHAVVLGRVSDPHEDVHLSAAEEDGIEIVRRSSGGGTVLQGPGCLNFCLVLSYARDPLLRGIHGSYEWIGRRLIAVLEQAGLRCMMSGSSDLALVDGRRKISGQAQHRGRGFLLHHGTLLIDFDVSLMERYLRLPRRQPAYRAHRPHAAFVANARFDRARFSRALAAVFDADWIRPDAWRARFDAVRETWIRNWREQGFMIRPPVSLLESHTVSCAASDKTS